MGLLKLGEDLLAGEAVAFQDGGKGSKRRKKGAGGAYDLLLLSGHAFGNAQKLLLESFFRVTPSSLGLPVHHPHRGDDHGQH